MSLDKLSRSGDPKTPDKGTATPKTCTLGLGFGLGLGLVLGFGFGLGKRFG